MEAFLCKLSGLSPDIVRALEWTWLSLPISAAWHAIPGVTHPYLKHAASAAIGMSVLFWLFGVLGLGTYLTIVLTTYGFCQWGSHGWAADEKARAKGLPVPAAGESWLRRLQRHAHIANFATSLVLLTAWQLERVIDAYLQWTIDVTAPLMMLTIKSCMISFSLRDGFQPIETLTPSQRQRRVQRMPDVLAFVGYMFFFPGILGGPALEHFFYMQGFREDAKEPARLWAALRRFAAGMFFTAVYPVMSRPVDVMCNADFLARGFLDRFLYYQRAAFAVQVRYYAPWFQAEAAHILAGIGYDEETGRWDPCRSINFWDIELSRTCTVLMNHWNMSVERWLRLCIYERGPKDEKGRPKNSNGRLIATFLISALWHGCYFGYYLAFLQVALKIFVERITKTAFRRPLVPGEIRPKKVAWFRRRPILRWKSVWYFCEACYNVWTFNMLGAPFVLYTPRMCWCVCRYDFFFIPQALLLVQWIIAMVVAQRKRAARRAVAKAANLEPKASSAPSPVPHDE